MTKKRDGYRNYLAQLTEVAWSALLADAEARGQSVTARLNEVLHKHYKISADKIPQPKRTGRKPKN